MKIILQILVYLIFNSIVNAQMPETPYIRDPFNEPLKIEYLKNKQNDEKKANRIKFNNIKSITRNHVNTPFGNIYNEFDRNGNITLSKWNKDDIDSEEYTYNSYGNVIKVKYIGKDDSRNYNELFEYENNNNLTRVITNRSEPLIKIEEYKYDDIGNVVAVIGKSSNNSIIKKQTLTYEKTESNLSIYSHIEYLDTNNLDYNPRINNKTFLLYKYKFDEKENITEKYSLDIRSNRYNLATFAYDGYMNVIEYEEYRIEGFEKELLKKIENTFDDNGVLIKDKANLVRAGTITSTCYYYDKYGNITQEDFEMVFVSSDKKTSNSSVIIYEYEFYK